MFSFFTSDIWEFWLQVVRKLRWVIKGEFDKSKVQRTWEKATNKMNIGIPISTHCPTWKMLCSVSLLRNHAYLGNRDINKHFLFLWNILPYHWESSIQQSKPHQRNNGNHSKWAEKPDSNKESSSIYSRQKIKHFSNMKKIIHYLLNLHLEKIAQSWLYPKIICTLEATISAPCIARIVLRNLCKSDINKVLNKLKKNYSPCLRHIRIPI